MKSFHLYSLEIVFKNDQKFLKKEQSLFKNSIQGRDLKT